MADAFIINGLRTFIGLKNKSYKNIPAEDLAAEVLKALNHKNIAQGIAPEMVIAGNCTNGGGNLARLALLKAGLGDDIPGITIDAQCASGLESIMTGYARIKSGLNSIVICGGAESASTCCVRSYNKNHPNHDPSKADNSYVSAQFIPETFCEDSMIMSADETCRKHGFTSDDLIFSAVESHEKAAKSVELIKSLALPVFGLEKDEGIRNSISKKFIERLAPVLPDGIINAATSCLFNDGAAFVTVADETTAKKSRSPVFKIRHAVTVGGPRFLSPESMIIAMEKLIEKSEVNENEIDRIDYNQAFACLDFLYKKRFSKPSNAFGGALAYGHPYGASGAIVVLHLMKALEHFDEHYGIAAVPAAGGIASAILLERMK
ncbi:thiolase family protein [Treponema sp.]|uniref:thiolase family protein n=1 Tax=Treponema sp. TaxID=166 RepID=UPI00388DD3AC